ncbi:DUF6317 family protein [Actinomadura rayongensis]|uniref:Uncharacterized protein n=1 Tax=Actinomadura rayongensis TaxID=1429076 RepID=A0A6I4W4H1_9ACTN|nr:DUF6317 family protein [Actinomadura rayongensis]MXQ64321.1 hypothetical protein [Actinomadura rayongensis]
MTGFQVTIDQLVYGGEKFKNTAVEYKGSLPANGFERPSTGGGELDNILGTTLQMLNLLHSMIADATWQHGEKLKLVAEKYNDGQRHSIAAIFQDVLTVITSPTDMPKFGDGERN